MFEGWGVAAAAVAAGGAIAASSISSSAAKSAANTQAGAAQTATDAQLQMYNTTRDDQAPWRAAGGQAVNALSQWYGLGGTGASPTGQSRPGTPGGGVDLTQLPGYQFQFNQGQKAVQNNLAAAGLSDSGAAGKALTQYGQGFAQQYGSQYVNGLQSLAGLGQSSVQNTGNIGANTANQIGGNAIYAGNANAAGTVGTANAINSGLQGLTGLYGQYQTQQQQISANQNSVTGYANANAGDGANYYLNNNTVQPIQLGGP
jgi:hypothetical protein